MESHHQNEKIRSQDDICLEDTTKHNHGGPSLELPLVSAFASHTRLQILRKFWRLYLIGIGVSLGGMYGGYCLSAAGNIVANPGA